MTGSKVLLPLRVPELGPSLGKLLSVTSGAGVGRWLDGVRYKLGTRIIECGGEARRLAASGERSATLAAIGMEVWKQAWDEAVCAASDLLTHSLDTHMEAEAQAVGMSRRQRTQFLFSLQEKRALMARLGSTGAELILVLDDLEEQAELALTATGLEPDAIRKWQDTLGVAARRLETAWLALEVAADSEITLRMQVAGRVARWRRPVWPVLIVALGAVPVATWFGLVLGGYIAEPGWLVGIWQMVFGG